MPPRPKITPEVDNGDPLHVPSQPKESTLTAIIDTREQLPLNLAPMKEVRGRLHTGDYSLVGLEHHVRIERKNFQDFLSCVTRERERFEKELERFMAFPEKALVIEATWEQVEAGDWPEYEDRRGELHKPDVDPKAALMSLYSWMSMGIPVNMVGTHERAELFVRRALYYAARRHFENVRRAIQGRMIPWMIPEEETGPPQDFI